MHAISIPAVATSAYSSVRNARACISNVLVAAYHSRESCEGCIEGWRRHLSFVRPSRHSLTAIP